MDFRKKHFTAEEERSIRTLGTVASGMDSIRETRRMQPDYRIGVLKALSTEEGLIALVNGCFADFPNGAEIASFVLSNRDVPEILAATMHAVSDAYGSVPDNYRYVRQIAEFSMQYEGKTATVLMEHIGHQAIMSDAKEVGKMMRALSHVTVHDAVRRYTGRNEKALADMLGIVAGKTLSTAAVSRTALLANDYAAAPIQLQGILFDALQKAAEKYEDAGAVRRVVHALHQKDVYGVSCTLQGKSRLKAMAAIADLAYKTQDAAAVRELAQQYVPRR